ncbi:hypothetical protein GH714_018110 [Hevea brasiliensis]|uniref:Uncharacterized protein n=1 Tax=Hevea brasiliensis TaxID=3981 RepID=A0A6A6LYA1_HEVBR|nr:hypothetical protein GH714_018110 [Hevea brasiliensis]
MLSVEDFFNEPNVCGDMGFVLSDSEGSFPSQEVSNEGNGWSPSPSIKSDESSSSLTLPGEESELNSLLSVRHLLKAYGEAMEKGQSDLADYLDKHGNYLKQESSKNFEAAFRAFYQIFPYGRFAHFAANSAILEAMPVDTETIHIVDFDMGKVSSGLRCLRPWQGYKRE